MKTENELNTDILNITMKIQQTHPELSKFIGEMPVKITDEQSKEVNLKNLQEYYKSLVTLLEKYDKTHTEDNTIIPQ
jgi:hypothetical protein